MEVLQGLSELLQNFGFPVVCFLMCAWYVKYREDRNDAQLEKLVSVHSAETDKLAAALNNNTLAIQKLSDLLGLTGAMVGGAYHDDLR